MKFLAVSASWMGMVEAVILLRPDLSTGGGGASAGLAGAAFQPSSCRGESPRVRTQTQNPKTLNARTDRTCRAIGVACGQGQGPAQT